MVAFLAATTLMGKAIVISSPRTFGAAVLQVIAGLLQSKQTRPKRLLRTTELGLVCMAVSCGLMHAVIRSKYRTLDAGKL
eukprot:SAG22_NODE_1196_length_5198_cov_3.167092_2_plen_80_part_00